MNIFKPVFIPTIDKLVYLNRGAFEPTLRNLNKMEWGFAPIGIDGEKVNLHHINRRHSAPLVILTATSHQKHTDALHSLPPPRHDKVNRSLFDDERKLVWEWLHKLLTNNWDGEKNRKPILKHQLADTFELTSKPPSKELILNSAR